MPNKHFIYSRGELSDELNKSDVKVGDFIIYQGNNQDDVEKYIVTTKYGKKRVKYFGKKSSSELFLPSTSISSSNSSKNKKRNRSTSGKSASGKSKSGKNASGKSKSISDKNKTKKNKK